MSLEVQFAVAKVRKYAMQLSGDTLEMIERPHGGLSLVLADGQRSGRSAKNISNVVARKAIQLLAEGVRDGAAARAAHDYLYTYRGGKVSASLNILSVDTRTRTLVISRNNAAPVLLHTAKRGVFLLDQPSQSVGIYPKTKPIITEIAIEKGTVIVAATDGLFHAGTLSGSVQYDPQAVLTDLLAQEEFGAQVIADTLLDGAVEKCQGRPRDDISVVVITVVDNMAETLTRRLSGRITV